MPTPLTAEAAETTAAATHEVSLKEAVKLCGRSEKTLRRKVDAGLIAGRREELEYGGFMWMIDLHSLSELYPGSEALDNLVENLDPPLETLAHVDPPQVRLSTVHGQAADEKLEEAVPSSVHPPSARPDFFAYLLDENHQLKDEIRERDQRIAEMQDRSTRLERELGEQQGTAVTQARVLEWFQQQKTQAALPPGPEEKKPNSLRPALLAVLATVATLAVCLGALGLLGV